MHEKQEKGLIPCGKHIIKYEYSNWSVSIAQECHKPEEIDASIGEGALQMRHPTQGKVKQGVSIGELSTNDQA